MNNFMHLEDREQDRYNLLFQNSPFPFQSLVPRLPFQVFHDDISRHIFCYKSVRMQRETFSPRSGYHLHGIRIGKKHRRILVGIHEGSLEAYHINRWLADVCFSAIITRTASHPYLR